MRTPIAGKPGLVVHAPQMVEVSSLNPAVYNPNKMNPKRYEALKASIREDGFVEPIVVQKNGMRIIGGHHRVRAVREICIEAGEAIPPIPAIVLDIDDRKAKRLNLKLNNLKGDPDAQLLGELLVDIYQEAPPEEEDLDLLGLERDDALRHIRLIEPDMVPIVEETDEPKAFAKAPTLSLEFSDDKLRDRVKHALLERAGVEKKKTGDVIAGLLLGGKSKAKKRAA